MVSNSKRSRYRLERAFYGGHGFTVHHAWGHNSERPLDAHFHEEYAISAQLGGTDVCTVGTQQHRFDAGDVVLINPLQPHTGNDLGNEDASEYVTVYVSKEVVADVCTRLRAPNVAPEFIRTHLRQNAALTEQAGKILELARAGVSPAIARTHVRDLLETVLVQHTNALEPRRRSTRRVAHPKIARTVRFLDDLDEQESLAVDIASLAQVAGLSRYHFIRMFGEHVGMTPEAYLRCLRLCRAGRLLRTTKTPIVRVAERAGYSDHSSFARAFANHMGMTPRQFRGIGNNLHG